MLDTTSELFQTCRYLGAILSSIILGFIFGMEISAAKMNDWGSFSCNRFYQLHHQPVVFESKTRSLYNEMGIIFLKLLMLRS